MVPTLIHNIGEWLNQFSDLLGKWEDTLLQVERAYLKNDTQSIVLLCQQGELIHESIKASKRERLELIEEAHRMGYPVRHLKELAHYFDSQWPALWTVRIKQLELQLSRVQTLSMSLWVGAFQSKSAVTEMLLILATGRSDTATYAPCEASAIEGGFLVNEAA